MSWIRIEYVTPTGIRVEEIGTDPMGDTGCPERRGFNTRAEGFNFKTGQLTGTMRPEEWGD